MTTFQAVTRELVRMADELAILPGQHEGELWTGFCTKAQELESLIKYVDRARVAQGWDPPNDGKPRERIPGTGLEVWETH